MVVTLSWTICLTTLYLVRHSCAPILYVKDLRNVNSFLTYMYYVEFAFPWGLFYIHFPLLFKFHGNVVLLPSILWIKWSLQNVYMPLELSCGGMCKNLYWSGNQEWKYSKCESQAKLLIKRTACFFVVQRVTIHIYTRYSLALSAAESFRGKMSTLMYENALGFDWLKRNPRQHIRVEMLSLLIF